VFHSIERKTDYFSYQTVTIVEFIRKLLLGQSGHVTINENYLNIEKDVLTRARDKSSFGN